MQQFDTMTLSFGGEAIKSVTWEAWKQNREMDHRTGAESVLQTAKHEALPPGISQLKYKEGQNCLLTFSAKVLGDDYLDGITRNNWDKVIDVSKPVIELDPEVIYDQAEVMKCDTTNNIWLEDLEADLNQVCAALLAGKRNDRFKSHLYQTKRKQGVLFQGTQEEKNRWLMYSKEKDLMKSQNRTFLRSLKDPVKMIETAVKQARVESNHVTHKSIRERLDIGNIKFQNVLDSKAPVNRDLLNKILKPGKTNAPDLFYELEKFEREGGQRSDFVYRVGLQTIIEWVDYSEEALKVFFEKLYPNKNTFKNHWYKKQNSIKQVLESMKCRSVGAVYWKSDIGVSVESVNSLCAKLLDALYFSVAA